jgi:hypothetical protein
MIKKVLKQIKNVFIPRSEFTEETPKKVEKKQASYTGVAAPITTPTDSWFSEPVKTEKVIAYEKHVAQKIEEQKFVEAAQPKKGTTRYSSANVCSCLPSILGTWQEELSWWV